MRKLLARVNVDFEKGGSIDCESIDRLFRISGDG